LQQSVFSKIEIDEAEFDEKMLTLIERNKEVILLYLDYSSKYFGFNYTMA
jgi:hypothetical protein